MVKKKDQDMEGSRRYISTIISKTYNSKQEQRERISQVIYNYGFWIGGII